MIKTNLHTHSTFSDGVNTLQEIAQSAMEKGFASLGFSDHSYTPFDPHYCEGMKDPGKYFEEVSSLKKSLEGRFSIFMGLELDYFSEIDCKGITDYIIGSVHYIEKDGIYYQLDYSAERTALAINNACGGSSDKYAEEYYNNVCLNIEKNNPDVLGHLDLITKFGTVDETTSAYRKAALGAADFAVERGLIIEINTNAVYRKLKINPYPHEFILKHIFEKGGRVTVNSDSHIAESLDFYFDECAELLKSIGFKSTWNLTKDGFKEFEI